MYTWLNFGDGLVSHICAVLEYKLHYITAFNNQNVVTVFTGHTGGLCGE